MRLLCIGDVVGNAGVQMLRRHLRTVQRNHAIDFTIVNGENASMVGMTPEQGQQIFEAGADVITLGNHVWGKRQITPWLEERRDVLRPCNLAPWLPGNGYGIYPTPFGRLLICNCLGRCEMKFGAENPFWAVHAILKREKGHFDFAVCEIHANATSEKLAMGYDLDGRCSAVWGTHTHIPTADARILPRGTGYITDIGMTGPWYSVLGVEIRQSLALFRGDLTERFREAKGPCIICGVIFDINTDGICTNVMPLQVLDEKFS